MGLTKHMISMCRNGAVPHVVMPKFQLPALTAMFGVKKLTCFALVGAEKLQTEKKGVSKE